MTAEPNQLNQLLQIIDTQAVMLGILLGLLVKKKLLTRDELLHRIQIQSASKPEFEQLLLKVAEAALAPDPL